CSALGMRLIRPRSDEEVTVHRPPERTAPRFDVALAISEELASCDEDTAIDIDVLALVAVRPPPLPARARERAGGARPPRPPPANEHSVIFSLAELVRVAKPRPRKSPPPLPARRAKAPSKPPPPSPWVIREPTATLSDP